MVYGFARWWHGVAGVGLLALLLSCSTVNRVVNLPFRAAENMLSTSERVARDPNTIPRLLDRGARSSSRLVPQGNVFGQSLRSPLTAPVSYQASYGSKDDLPGSSQEWDVVIPLLP